MPLIPLAGPLCWNEPFPAVTCPMSYVRLAAEETGLSQQLSGRCLSFIQTSSVDNGLWNPINSHCLVAIFITCRLVCVIDSMPFYVLPQCVTKSDERPIRLAKVCSFWPQVLQSFPSSLSLEKLHEGRLVVVWRPVLISVGCSGMRWGWVYDFPKPDTGTGPRLYKKRGWFRQHVEYL